MAKPKPKGDDKTNLKNWSPVTPLSIFYKILAKNMAMRPQALLEHIIRATSQVPSPTHVIKSQHGDRVPTFEPQEIIRIWLTIIKTGC